MNANFLASLAACLRRRYKLTTPLRPTHRAKHVGNKLPLAEHHNSIGNRMLTRTCAKVTFLGVGSAQTLGPREPLKGFAQYPKTPGNNRKTQVGENGNKSQEFSGYPKGSQRYILEIYRKISCSLAPFPLRCSTRSISRLSSVERGPPST